MDEDPFPGWGLKPVELADQAVLNPYFASLAEPLSDYTFSQLFTWRNSLRILWKLIDGHLCVFANGSGDLTLLLPPIGDTGSGHALREAFDLMNEYNVGHGVPQRTRVEYASEELLRRFDRDKLVVQPMGADYVYDIARMIDLAGGDLASKRQAKNRFLRNYVHRVEPYRAADHLADCVALLDLWKIHQDAQHLDEPDCNSVKRSKESIATALCLEYAERLSLNGLVVYVKQPESQTWSLRGFTFGEHLGAAQSSITIEKTDLEVKGLAQFIFSDFCRTYWSDRPYVNVGDDWGLQTLAWTKMSYRPVKLLQKFVLRTQPTTAVAPGFDPARSIAQVPAATISAAIEANDTNAQATAAPKLAAAIAADTIREEAMDRPAMSPTTIRPATASDVDAAAGLEQANFRAYALSKRQLQYLQKRHSAIFLVGEQNGVVVGDGIALVRQHRNGHSGRIYSLVVRAECRGQHIGQKLLEAMVEALSARGVRRVYLEVEADNQAAVHLYERAGFRSIGTLPDYYGNGKPGVHMMLVVEEPEGVRTGEVVGKGLRD